MVDEPNDGVGITKRTTGQALVLRLTGDIDLLSSGSVHTRLRAAVAQLPPPALVVVDLTDVPFFSAAGVRMLHAFVTACADRELTTRLAVTPETVVRRVITITDLDNEVATFDTLAQALNPDQNDGA